MKQSLDTLTQVSGQGDIVSSVGRNRTSYSELKVDGVGLDARAGQGAGIKIGFQAWIQTKGETAVTGGR